MYKEILLNQVNSFKKSNEWHRIKGTGRRIISYLLTEVTDIAEYDRFSIRKCDKNKKIIPLFELIFTFGGLYVHTIHKCGAMNVKFIKDGKNKKVFSTKSDIEAFCKYMGWMIVSVDGRINQREEKLSIFWNIQEEESS